MRRSARTRQTTRVTFAPDDNALRSMLADAELAPLVPAVAQLTGDYSLLREDLRPDPALVLEPEGGLTEDQLAEIRELLFGALSRWRDAGSPPAPDPTDDELRRLMAYLITDDGLVADYLPVMRRGARARRRGPAGARLAQGRHRARPPFTVAIVGAGHVGPARRAPPRAGRASPYVDLREERRRRRHVVGEHLSRVPGRRRRTTSTATRSPSATTGRSTSRPQAELLDYFRAVRRRVRPAPAHPLRAPRSLDADVRRGHRDVAGRARERPTGRPRRQTVNAVISAVGQLNRPQLPDDPGPRHVRRPGVPLGALGSRRRPHGKRVGGDRHRRQRAPSSSRSSPSRPRT